jgi:hypothetical protein
MVAVARALSRAFRTRLDIEAVKSLAVFCGAGLLISLLLAMRGVDIGTGFL